MQRQADQPGHSGKPGLQASGTRNRRQDHTQNAKLR